MRKLHPVALQTELEYKARCEAKGVKYVEPTADETKSDKTYRRLKMNHAIDPTLRVKKAEYMKAWHQQQKRRAGGNAGTKKKRPRGQAKDTTDT